jgi:colanic acid/amylovoran biosynthesis glycosyltransferase
VNVAVIVNTFPELSETFIINHIAGEILANVDITVFSVHRSKSKQQHDIIKKYGIDKRTIYVNIPRNLFVRFLFGISIFIRLFFKNRQTAIEALKFSKYQTVAKNFKLLFFGLCFLDKKFDIVHCHFGMNGLIGVFLKNRGFCRKVITTFHGADINSYIKKYGPNIYKTLYKESDVITTNTDFTKSKIIQNGGPSQIHIIPEGLFFDDYKNQKPFSKIPNSILTVGRLEEKKGYYYSLNAIALIKRIIPDINYFIIGDGSLHDELTKLVVRLGISDNCHFLGSCTSTKIREYYQKCSIFILPSVTASNGDMEGQGLVLQEAQASGIPVISTIHNGIPDGILKDTSGFLIPEKDSEQLAQKILVLLNNDKLRSTMGKAGIEFVKKKYDIPIIVKMYNNCYWGHN